MAGWMTLFRAVPWIDLIAAAPGVARGAKKLWTDIRHGPPEAGPAASGEERLAALEAQVQDLRKDLDASAELVRTLAEQNARLVEAVGILRARQLALVAGCIVLTVFSIVLGYRVWG